MPDVALSGAAGRIKARLNELAREGRPMSQATLALAIGVGRNTVNQWLHGVSQPDRRQFPELYKRIAVALGLDAESGAVWILAGDTIRPRPPHDPPPQTDDDEDENGDED